jgi:hypothetical protein
MDDLAKAKETRSRFIKYQAQQEILSIAPYYKQMNALRENGPSDPLFAQIDAVRARSNELEAAINAAASISEILAINW